MRVRAAVLADAVAVHALLVEREVAELGAPDSSLEDLRDQWRGSGFDLSADARVVEAADRRIVGFAVVARPGTMVVVAPAHQGQGLGTRLRLWAEQRERERGRERHRQWIAAGNERARDLLLAAGYRRERSYLRLVRRVDDLGASGSAPAGVNLRAVHIGVDAPAIHALTGASFAENADFRPYSFEAFRETHLEAHDFAPELSCVAEHGGRLVGFLLAWWWREPNIGFVDLIGTHPDHMRRGLGKAMMDATFARFAAAGIHQAQLGVASDNLAALRLYRRSGMTERFRTDTYERPVEG